MLFFLLLLFIGLVAGILAGLFGVGGGILFTPILFFIFSGHAMENPVVWTIGTSLFCTFMASAGSSVQQIRQHNLYLKQGVMVGVLGTVGVYAGKQLVMTPLYTESVFVIFFATILLFVAFMFYRKSRGVQKSTSGHEYLGWGKAGVTGGLGGVVASLAGVGGGVVMVPVMNLVYRIDLKRAVSVSSLAIVIISFSGWMQFALFSAGGGGVTNYTLGNVDFGTALPLVAGALTGGYVGVRLNHTANEKSVQAGFSILVIAVAIVMLYKLL